jgi:hypothetical protein
MGHTDIRIVTRVAWFKTQAIASRGRDENKEKNDVDGEASEGGVARTRAGFP